MTGDEHANDEHTHPAREVGDEPADAHSDQDDDIDLGAAEAAEVAVDHLVRLTGQETLRVLSVRPTDDGWSARIAVVAQAATANTLGFYEVELDMNDELLAYRRTRCYARDRTGW